VSSYPPRPTGERANVDYCCSETFKFHSKRQWVLISLRECITSARRICFVTKEFFDWGKYGGFGSYVRLLGTELSKRGYEVSAVVPRSENQQAVERVNGVDVYGLPYPTSLKGSVASEILARALAPLSYSKCRADVYHSINPSFYSLLAQTASPAAKHVIAFCDLRDMRDWKAISSSAALVDRIRSSPLESPFMKRIVGQAHGTYALTEFLADKAVKMYGLRCKPPVLYQPVEVPERRMRKSARPTVCFLGRLDPIKRPEIFLEMARQFPKVNFLVMGQTTVPWDYQKLIAPYRHLKNLKFLGWVFGDEKSKVLEASWVLINTSVHEALPVSFLEAWAHECAVLSGANPDWLVERFGHWARNGDYAEGLRYLLAGDIWRKLGKGGRGYVETNHDLRSRVDQLIDFYQSILG
jgi:glycosyltransferase involved in cell wall biosynthesis